MSVILYTLVSIANTIQNMTSDDKPLIIWQRNYNIDFFRDTLGTFFKVVL